MSDILKRSISGAVFVLIMIAAFVYSSYSAVSLLFLLTLIGLKEFYQLFSTKNLFLPQKRIGLIGGGVFFWVMTAVHFDWLNATAYLILVPLFFIVLIGELYRNKKEPVVNIALTFFAWIYIPLLFFSIVLIRDFFPSDQWKFVIGMFITIWANDSFAYLTGRWLGKNKLFERISPKKTWEGTFGGVFFAMIFAVTFSQLFELDFVFWLVSGLLIAIASVLGDLFESLLKRSAGVKDSGNIMPGHGGVLDRFDAALFAGPVFLLWMIIYYSA
jgi:phosphatidate cytidylyltransferase